MKKFMSVFIAMFLLLLANQAMAATYGPTGWDGNNLESFLKNITSDDTHFSMMSNYDFEGMWNYTAIGFESGHANHTQVAENGNATFTKVNTIDFGNWKTVDSTIGGLYFDDGHIKKALIPSNNVFFEIYQLTQDTTLYYANLNSFVLQAGTFIVGFNDAGNDSDFDDFILAMNPVPEPATIFLFGIGLLGLAGVNRRKK